MCGDSGSDRITPTIHADHVESKQQFVSQIVQKSYRKYFIGNPIMSKKTPRAAHALPSNILCFFFSPYFFFFGSDMLLYDAWIFVDRITDCLDTFAWVMRTNMYIHTYIHACWHIISDIEYFILCKDIQWIITIISFRIT